MISIVVTGANGQMGKCLQDVAKNNQNIEWVFKTSKELDITNQDSIQNLLKEKQFNYLINCAAYTAVDKAETETKKAFQINAEAVKYVAEACKLTNTVLIHISTDFVFDGTKKTPYTEKDEPNPINVYGASKLKGEQYIQEILERFYIIRTSWLYSEHGHNFFKTIVRKSETETELTIVTSETGTPTNANDLAKFILEIILDDNDNYGVYHYSNQGEATWYDFTKEILRFLGKLKTITLKKTDNYPTFAKRPKYSVLSKEKTIKIFQTNILDWDSSLFLINKSKE